jgi:transcriptional regulator with XRE-family HTH domain
MSLATRLRELRVAKRESLQQVADAVGLSKTHVWELEKGNTSNPSIDILKRLADHFEVPIYRLTGEDMDDPTADPEIVSMFRLASESNLNEDEKRHLRVMLQSLLDMKDKRRDAD